MTIVSSDNQFSAESKAPPDVWNGGEGNKYTTPIKTMPTPTWYRVSATGIITMTPDPNAMPGQPPRYYGPAGYARASWGDGWNNSSVVIGTSTSDSTASDYAFINGSLTSVDRGDVGKVEWNAYCGSGYPWPCGSYSGPATSFTFTRLDADLSLTADSTNVGPGSTVKFSYGASPAQVEGKTMPVVIDSIFWTPDPDSLGGEKTEQPYSGNGNICNGTTSTCSRQIIGSGTFTMIAWVNGRAITKSAHVQTPTLTLKANPPGVPVGGTIAFTPSWSDAASVTPAQVTSWAWAADTLTGATSACAAGISPCRTSVKEAGTMTVRVSRGGVTRTAKVHVTIVSCPTGDALLDRPEIRQGLKDMWTQSGADTQPDIANRNEYMFGAYQDVDGSMFFQQILPAGFPCGVNADVSQIPKTLGTATLVATFHPHPFEWNATYPANCGSMAGSKYNNADPLTRLGGRASGGDWKASQVLGLPGYIMDFDGIYRYDGTNARILPVGGTDNYIVTDGMSHYQSWQRVDSTHQCTRP